MLISSLFKEMLMMTVYCPIVYKHEHTQTAHFGFYSNSNSNNNLQCCKKTKLSTPQNQSYVQIEGKKTNLPAKYFFK
jgi:hypothetical protein